MVVVAVVEVVVMVVEMIVVTVAVVDVVTAAVIVEVIPEELFVSGLRRAMIVGVDMVFLVMSLVKKMKIGTGLS
jgi:hypothetical protein